MRHKTIIRKPATANEHQRQRKARNSPVRALTRCGFVSVLWIRSFVLAVHTRVDTLLALLAIIRFSIHSVRLLLYTRRGRLVDLVVSLCRYAFFRRRETCTYAPHPMRCANSLPIAYATGSPRCHLVMVMMINTTVFVRPTERSQALPDSRFVLFINIHYLLIVDGIRARRSSRFAVPCTQPTRLSLSLSRLEGEKRRTRGDRPTAPLPPLSPPRHHAFHSTPLHHTWFAQGQASMRSFSWAVMESRSPIADGADHVLEVGMLGGRV